MEEIEKVHKVLDVSDATDEEIQVMKEALTIAATEIVGEGMRVVRNEGLFHGCAHTHLMMAIISYHEKVQCDDREIELPRQEDMN